MAKLRKSERSEEIERVIAYLFARKGYHSTTMRDIARELGMHQSSLYHYFKSKEAVLFKIMNDCMETGLKGLDEIYGADYPLDEKLKNIFSFYIQHFAQERERHILLDTEMNSLNKRHRRILIDKQRRYTEIIRSIIIDLINEKKVKNIHPTIATFAFFGMFNYTSKWYRSEGTIRPAKLADMLIEIITEGLFKGDLK